MEGDDYIFGFGSIINTSTHSPWLKDLPGKTSLPGILCDVKASFGYERQWNYRSSTGFTALGIVEITNPNDDASHGMGINGVAYRVSKDMIPFFDKREVGYERVQVPLHQLEFPHHGTEQKEPLTVTSADRVWIYIPLPSNRMTADENHPILQSYVDTVLQGCLEWGGEPMAHKFVLSTSGWSTYFLNDTPSSRRPWLFRKDYDIIDNLLKANAALVHYDDRKHPEEFASAFYTRMKGTWGLPRRNPNFTGRDKALQEIHSRLGKHTMATTTIQGMGGVGKSQTAVEYCYRHLGTLYGLIVWLNAESSEALVADYRQLLMDFRSDQESFNEEKDTAEVISEVKTRLFRSKVPWLLVFDNLEDFSLLEKFSPRGTGRKGHILVTTRIVDLDQVGQHGLAYTLDCFEPSESVELLRRAAGSHNMVGKNNIEAANAISERLGHLPLALGMAAAYMLRCDVQATEYLERQQIIGEHILDQGKLRDYSLTISASLSLSFDAIERDNPVATDVLRLLSFLGPDLITKAIIRSLLASRHELDVLREKAAMEQTTFQRSLLLGLAAFALMGTFSFQTGLSRRTTASMILLPLSIFAVSNQYHSSSQSKQNFSTPRRRVSALAYEQTDQVWNILKSFSLLTVKEGKGSIHRLLAQAIRDSQSVDITRQNVVICISALEPLWTFEAQSVESWTDSSLILEHIKSIVKHVLALDLHWSVVLRASRLSREVGVFSAMALNAFIEAETSLELSKQLLDRCAACKGKQVDYAMAECCHELGRVLRYQGALDRAENSLRRALSIRNRLSWKDGDARQLVADTLHELGVLEVKKHRLDLAAKYLQDSLAMRRSLDVDNTDKASADCAATLHQLASVHVSRRPPSLDKAESLLKEALDLSVQIAQRAATLKQLARVTIRRGKMLEKAESYLQEALELYKEFYGANKSHMNIAAVLFQQGALYVQQGRLDEAWSHYAECLRMRRIVYKYACPPVDQSTGDNRGNPIHLEVTSVLHEMGCVAFSQGRYEKSMGIFHSEGEILVKLEESSSSSHVERLRQGRLTNLLWLRKCAKELGNDTEAARFAAERNDLKKRHKEQLAEGTKCATCNSQSLQYECLACRQQFRLFALKADFGNARERDVAMASLNRLQNECKKCPASTLKRAATNFRYAILLGMKLNDPKEKQRAILQSCDQLRDSLRAERVQVNDSVVSTISKGH